MAHFQAKRPQTSIKIVENIVFKNELRSSGNQMRVVQNTLMELGEIDVSQIKFDLRSRDDIPKILCGLQRLYLNEALRHKVFALLVSEIAPR